MTATVQHHHKSILLSPQNKYSLKRCRSETKKPPVSVGKLRNIRNFYARRRPSMLPVVKRVVSPLPERGSRVRFHDDVSVHSIPSRKDYSQEEKEEIWMPRAELKQLIKNNHTEFAFEGRDWRNAPEEDDFATDENGDLLHPAHVAQKVTSRVQVVVHRKRRLCLWRRQLPSSSSVPEEDQEPQCKRFRFSNDSEEMDL